MMPTTPIGIRTCAISRPFGRRQVAIVSPTGSGRAAISSRPAAIASTRAGVSVNRSTRAALSPAWRAASTSPALAVVSAPMRSRRRVAAARSAAFFAAGSAVASGRAAWRAARQSATTLSAMSVIGSIYRRCGGGSIKV
jgi:hypothetical protein